MAIDGEQCRFRVLGPVQVLSARGPLVFSRRQQLDLLALLLLQVDRAVPISQIVDAMWGDAAPRTAATQIRNMASALRRNLVDGPRTLATIDRQPAGYRLRIADGQLDLELFTALLGEARAAAKPDAIAATLRRALALWQGSEALVGVRADFADAARTHLQELHNTALEDLFDAELECANHTRIVAELTTAVADNPGRERLAGQLMIALYRGGRTTDALAVYRRVRRILADEHGMEPGADLRRLERLILRGDPKLDLPPAPAIEAIDDLPSPARPTVPPVPAQLPHDVSGFVGRDAELARLNAVLDGLNRRPTAVVISALMGTAGIGKTALAVHWAHRVADKFPDGQLYVNLRGFDPSGSAMSPAEAIRGFLDAFGIPPERIPASIEAQAALYRSVVAGRRMLVVLDNAAGADQARPLLPGASGCLVLVTSRSRLTALVAAEGAEPITLDLLTDEEARDFLVARLGAERVAAEEPAAAEIAVRCAHLPLALAVVAARAAVHPTFPLASLSAELSASGPDSSGAVRTALSWSYERLGSGAARLFRLLGLHAGPDIAAPAAASLAGQPITGVRRLLGELADAHLVAEHSPGRFGLHDLLRAYAAELAGLGDSDVERRVAVCRVLDHYLHTASAAADLLYPHRYPISLVPPGTGVTAETFTDHEHAVEWFNAEHRVLVAAVEQAAADDLSTRAWQLASTIAFFFDRQCHWLDWASTQRSALAAADRVGDRIGRAHAHGGLGSAHLRLGDLDLARTHLDRALTLFGELGDRAGQAHAHMRLATVHQRRAEHAEALRRAEQALELYRAAGHRPGYANAMNSVGWFHAELGRYREAIAFCEQAVALLRELGDRLGAAHTMDSLGYAYHQLGEYEQAARFHRQAAEVLHESGGRSYEAVVLIHLGDSYHAAGEADLARDAWQEALSILDALNHPEAEQARARLRRLETHTGSTGVAIAPV